MLSNAHVLAFAGNLAARIGDDILEGTSGNTVIAELEAWSGLLSGESLTDAAIAQVNQPDDAEFSIVDLGRPRYDPAVRPFVGMPVRMRGAPGELITATVHRTQASQDHSLFIPMRGEMQVRFSDQLVIKYDTPRPALLSGYSGSAVVDENNHLLGLFWMGSRNFGLVCKIEHVFEEFQVNLAGNVAAVPASAASLAAPGDDTVDILAKTVWGEARGEPPEGREAVASVIVNRAARRPAAWWGSTIKEVCLKPWQFSCWNENDPNRALLDSAHETEEFGEIERIAQLAVEGNLTDLTDGATHYHTRNINPHWSANKQPCAEIGDHKFYNDIE